MDFVFLCDVILLGGWRTLLQNKQMTKKALYLIYKRFLSSKANLKNIFKLSIEKSDF